MNGYFYLCVSAFGVKKLRADAAPPGGEVRGGVESMLGNSEDDLDKQ